MENAEGDAYVQRTPVAFSSSSRPLREGGRDDLLRIGCIVRGVCIAQGNKRSPCTFLLTFSLLCGAPPCQSAISREIIIRPSSTLVRPGPPCSPFLPLLRAFFLVSLQACRVSLWETGKLLSETACLATYSLTSSLSRLIIRRPSPAPIVRRALFPFPLPFLEPEEPAHPPACNHFFRTKPGPYTSDTQLPSPCIFQARPMAHIISCMLDADEDNFDLSLNNYIAKAVSPQASNDSVSEMQPLKLFLATPYYLFLGRFLCFCPRPQPALTYTPRSYWRKLLHRAARSPSSGGCISPRGSISSSPRTGSLMPLRGSR